MTEPMKIIFLCYFVSATFGLNVDILPPVVNSSTEAALIICPGAYIQGSAYKPLGLAIQQAAPLSLWVALLDGFIGNLVNPPQLDIGFSLAIRELKEHGMKSENIFLAGHSLGGTFVGMFGQSNAKRLKGVLLYASYVTTGHKLADYPVPLLTISGTLDGLTRVTRIVDTFEELQSDVAKDRNAMYRTPVVVMEGVNHGQFASGDMPPNVKEHDLPADGPEDYSHVIIANRSRAFIVVTLGQPKAYQDAGHGQLYSAYYSTQATLKPLSTVKSLDQNTQGESMWTEMAQKFLAGQEANRTMASNAEVSEVDLESSHPSVILNASKAAAKTFTTVTMPFNPADVSEAPQTPVQLNSKMMSQEAIASVLPNATMNGTNMTCMDLNRIAYLYAFNSSSQVARQRHADRKGKSVHFIPDVVVETEEAWLLSTLELVYSEDGLDVMSYAFITSLNSVTSTEGEDRGVHHCKLLSPYRALEYIYIDSLKPN